MYICINEDITNATVNRVLETLLAKDKEDKTIVVFVNSQGGDVDSGYAIYELFRLSGCRIITYTINECFSSAVIVFLAGEERYATDYSTFMIHEPFHEYRGEGDTTMTANSYRRNLKELQESTDEYFKLISKHTTLTLPKIKSFISRSENGDWYLKSSQAKKLGLVTKIGVPLG